MHKRPGRGPPGHLSRLKPVEQDPLAEYGLPSKGEKRLLSPRVQESYYAQIVARYLAVCTAAGDRDTLQKQFARLSLATSSDGSTPSELQPPPSPLPPPSQPHQPEPTPPSRNKERPGPSEEESQHLPQIFAALRKLREGLVASHRRDHFAVQAYLFSARAGILAGAYEAYYPALLHLLRWRNLALTPTPTPLTPTTTEGGGNDSNNNSNSSISSSLSSSDGTLTTLERQEVVTYLILDAACRRGDLAGAYRLRNEERLRDGRVDAALRALVADDWVGWRRVAGQVDGYRARLMAFAEARVARHTLKAFGRAYHAVPLGFLEEQTGCGWADLTERYGVGWEVDGGTVVIRKVKGR